MRELVDSLQTYMQARSILAYAAAFAGGFLISFTPCIYPVVPITVGYIGSKSLGSRARGFALSTAYVTGMAFTYALLGGAAALTGRVFGEVAASPAVNLVVGAICIAFALSLFDILHIPFPSISPGRERNRPPGGIPGAFGIGMASGLVVGPCTAPVLGGILLYVASRQNIMLGMSLLFTFAFGMGSLLIILGTFSGFLAGLPKSGKWLVAVKTAFGIMMIGAGAYFLFQAGKLLV